MESRGQEIQDIIQQLRVVFKESQAHSKSVEQECGLSGAKLWMLYEVSATHGLRVSQLAKVLSIHPSTCSNMLDKLEEKDLLYRDRSKTDQRSVHLYITDKGKEVLAKAPGPPKGKLSQALENISDEQLVMLNSGLSALVDSLNISPEKEKCTSIIGG